MSGEALEAVGTIASAHRGDLHAVDVEIGGAKRRVLCRRAGRLVRNWIRLLPGDRVRVELSPYDPKRGRIVQRFAPGEDESASLGRGST